MLPQLSSVLQYLNPLTTYNVPHIRQHKRERVERNIILVSTLRDSLPFPKGGPLRNQEAINVCPKPEHQTPGLSMSHATSC